MDLASSNAMARKALDFVSTHTITHTNPTGPAVIGITASSIGNQYYTVLYITGADSHRSIVLISNTGARARRAAVMSAVSSAVPKRRTIKRNPDKTFAEGTVQQYGAEGAHIYTLSSTRAVSLDAWLVDRSARTSAHQACACSNPAAYNVQPFS